MPSYKLAIASVAFFWVCFASTAQDTFTISGYISDFENGESLIGATVYDVNSVQGVISNTFGFFSLTLPVDTIQLRISYVGYETLEQNFFLDKDQSLKLQLSPGGLLQEVVVTGKERIEATPQMSTIDVGIDKIKALPALLGEQDVLKSIQLLPGIQSGTEGSSGIYVRGGGPDQNLILLDGVPVYNASHLFGFFSVFNPDAINKVSVSKGGFPARYGGRLSSVIDISMKEGNNKKFTGSGSIGLISSKLTLEGPIASEKTSFIVSARRTYIDILARPLIRAVSEGDEIAGYYFYDLNAKINHTFSDKDRLYWSFYSGSDKAYARSSYDYVFDQDTYESKDEFGLNWGNVITAVRWNHLFTPKLFSNLTATYSQYQFKVFNEYIEEITGPGTNESRLESFEYRSGINDLAVKLDFDYLPTANHSIKFGAMVIRHEFSPGVAAFQSNTEIDTTFGSNSIFANEFSAYVEDDFSIGKKLRFNIGLHTSMFQVEDETYTSFQPRISGRFMLPYNIALKASYAEMTQFIHLLTNGGLGLPTDLWVPATDQIKPQESWQAAVGLAKTVGKFELSVEGYYKEMQNLIEYQEGASFVNTTDNWETKVASGNGTSYGVELFAQKNIGKLTGWVGYTWSKTTRQFDELNFGRIFPYKFDRRHDLSVVGIYELNDHWDISGTWVYGTGNAITMPQSSYQYYPNNLYSFRSFDYNQNYGERNSYRMRAYHRADISLTKTKVKRNTTRTWSFGAYNVYSRRNPFFIDQSYDNQGNRKFIQYSLFPFIPFVKWGFQF